MRTLIAIMFIKKLKNCNKKAQDKQVSWIWYKCTV